MLVKSEPTGGTHHDAEGFQARSGRGKPVEDLLKVRDRPFTEISAQVLGHDEIGIFPKHGTALASALANGDRAIFKPASGDQFDFPVPPSVMAWLRACARRNGMKLEPASE